MDKAVLATRIPPEAVVELQRLQKSAQRRGEDFKVKQPRQAEPRGLERQLQVEYRKRLAILFSKVDAILFSRLPSALDRDRAQIEVVDDLSEDIFIILAGIKVQFAQEAPDLVLRNMLKRMGLAVNGHNLRQFRKVFKSSLGVDPFVSEPWLDSRVNSFVEQNVALIKSVDEKFYGEIQERVFAGARQGLPAKEISTMIRDRYRVSKSRADLIARDQINKFNGQLNQIRQQAVGVAKYRWRTSLDERVRPHHASREGKEFSWSEPPSGGHPGEEIQCRCYAEPVLEELIGE